MATFSYKNDEDQDERANPATVARGLNGAEEATGRNSGINAGIDQAEAFANDPKNSSKNIDAVNQQEQTPNQFNYDTSAPLKQPGKFSLKGKFVKRGGPLGLLIGGILAGVFGLGVMISPSLAVIHMKEVLTGDLNDQVTAMDMRSKIFMKAKFKNLGKTGTCTLVKIRCGLRGMSDKQVENFKKAGIDVETSGKVNAFGKNDIKSLTFTDSTGKKIPVTNPAKFNRLVGDMNIRNQLRRAYNPKFYALSDKVSSKIFGPLGGKSRKLTSSDPKKLDEEINKAVAGESTDVTHDTKQTNKKDNQQTKNDTNAANAESIKLADSIKNGSGGVKGLFSSVGKGALKGASITGAADSACSVYSASRAVSAMAKIKRATQLARYALIFMNFADTVKAGDATPEQAEKVGNTLIAVDTEKEIVDETSTLKGTDASKVANPDYGKNAFDSQAIHASYYNDAPTPTARTMSYGVGGGLTGRLDGVNSKIAHILGAKNPSEVRDKCRKVQNNWVRGGSLIVGIALGAVTFGWSLAAQTAVSVGISLAMPILQSYLSDIVSGKVVSSDTKGVDAGNAIMAGTAVMLGDMAKTRGMKPASTSDLKSYVALKDNIENEYIAMETEDAKKTPFDINNQYSFLGSLSRKMLPAAQTSGNILNSFNVLSLLSISANALTPTTFATQQFNSKRFSKCSDEGYKTLGIDADVMCNVRYTLSNVELAMDTDNVYQEMADKGYVDGDTGEAQSDYAKWLTNCTQRTDGWGETTDDGPDGSECLKRDHVSSLFRVYTIDQSIGDGMDNGPDSGDASSSNTAALTFTTASFNFCHEDIHPECRYPNKSSKIASVIAGTAGFNSSPMDIVGAQEVSPSTQKEVTTKLGNYASFPTSVPKSNGIAVFWNTQKFGSAPVSSGYVENIHGNGGKPGHHPWVELKSIEGRSVFYLSIHSPNNAYGGPQDRIDNAQKYYAWAKPKATGDNLVIISGDFNNSKPTDGGKPSAYCILTAGSVMQNAVDLQKGTTGCNTTKGIAIDQIYNSTNITGLKASGYAHVDDKKAGTDHSPAYITYSIPGADSTGNGNPGGSVGGDDYKECSKYLHSGYYCPGQAYSYQCTAFVNFRLAKHGVIKPTDIVGGNGKEVVGSLKKMGFDTGTTPQVNSVFSNPNGGGGAGHTGMVSKVNANGSIVVEEYNYKPKAYSTRTLTKAQYAAFTFAYTGSKYK